MNTEAFSTERCSVRIYDHVRGGELRMREQNTHEDQCSQMLGIFPNPGISNQSLGLNFDHWEIPKTLKSLGILTSGTKIRILPLKRSKNAQFMLKYNPCLKIWEVEISQLDVLSK